MAQGAAKQNPFQQLLSECDNDPSKLQLRYDIHRTARNAQYKATILSPNFPGWSVDEILRKLHQNDSKGDGQAQFVDPRKNLAFYARPPQHIRELVNEIQQDLKSIAPNIWFTPPDYLHMTTLELINSRTSSEIDTIISDLQASGMLPELLNYICSHRSRLVRPIVSYDASAMALSFVPAAGERTDQTSWETGDDTYTYHHLRRDLFDRVTDTGIQVVPRYVVPSAHVTIARFITHDGFRLENSGPDGSGVDRERLKAIVDKIEDINRKLKERYWPSKDSGVSSRGEWLVGEGIGLELCGGASWYGKGDSVITG